jgi:hypothetical protein
VLTWHAGRLRYSGSIRARAEAGASFHCFADEA